ncbi:type I restriction-modification system subunit M [Gulosibacter molinativorax]|uniref:site-specific DNA-methyltransferase (adenine-specific) n=1 Tax=Gulosibacter molinativorax TaxID=256821 RepID=A0ABT7C909_9MICO|nr:class I SAM-dependent DNA methyltransferase [Gulosibacter molinativorax]MDJ1371677.1 SAM-dependent DNA methyltransferase [Gulosibacter molinativorax]QUY63099.1 Type I restriction-modification system methyltransferase subunit [Gulosibacter molinativorax]
MPNTSIDHARIVSLIWGIADDVLRDLYVRGKYRDVILPFTVIRRLDSVLEPTRDAVMNMKAKLDDAGIANQDGPLRAAAGQHFYNTSGFTLKDLRNRANATRLRQDFEAYLDGFSPNVQEIIDNFELRHQLPRLTKADALGSLIEKFLQPDLDLSPNGIDNHGMGTVFEELVRKFNEENNEEAGEHWTPRDAVRLMTRLMFEPVADAIPSGTYRLYDGAMGTGGMLTVAEETLRHLTEPKGKKVSTHLYGQEINAETYAIAKADLILKGDGDAADNIKGGPEYSTLSNDAFAGQEFDFMLSNPPYGKSWKTDQERLGGAKRIIDPRFVVEHNGDPEYSLVTRSSDGQLMFLVNLIAKMKQSTELGSRIASVHNGSSLFTGDAGQGESNIRRWIIENDWLEAIVALPLKMFYNTGIATYVWVLSNRKEERRKGKVQLINATDWFTPLRKNLGEKGVEVTQSDADKVLEAFNAFEAYDDPDHSKVFDGVDFGYTKITVERPLRIAGIDPNRVYSAKEIKQLKEHGVRDESAPPVIRKALPFAATMDPLYGRYEAEVGGRMRVVEYEPDTELRDTEQVPLTEPSGDYADGVEAFFRREVEPYAPDAWIDDSKTKVGYEISFTRHFYKPAPMRTLAEIQADIRALEAETEDLIAEIAGDH